MQTPTHLLIGAAALTTPGRPWRNAAVLVGAFLPDLSIYVMFAYAKLWQRMPGEAIWPKPAGLYWQEPWQTLSAISNSFPLWCALLVIGLLARSELLWVFAAAAVLHLCADFPVHAADAHVHFWPLTDWRFHSPISYWDHRYFGTQVSLLELGLTIALIVLLMRRFGSLWVRVPLVLALSGYVLVPLYFRYID